MRQGNEVVTKVNVNLRDHVDNPAALIEKNTSIGSTICIKRKDHIFASFRYYTIITNVNNRSQEKACRKILLLWISPSQVLMFYYTGMI